MWLHAVISFISLGVTGASCTFDKSKVDLHLDQSQHTKMLLLRSSGAKNED